MLTVHYFDQDEAPASDMALGMAKMQEARIAAKRDQRGIKNTSWKGDDASYQAFHLRVYERRGRPAKCAQCGTDDPMRRFHWANLTGNYADVSDYAPMCVPCHKRYDLDRRRRDAK